MSPLPFSCLHAPSAAGSFCLRLPHCAGRGQCLWAPTTPGRGIPPGTLAPSSGPQGRHQIQQRALLSFCWESCKTEVALSSYTGTWKSCSFSQCKGRLQIPPRAQGSFTCSRGAGLLYPVQSPFPSSSTSSKGKTQLQYFTFLFR